MKHFLLPEEGCFYKANLHSHSTVSDGKLSPEKMKQVYMDLGYSIIAYTDHNILQAHQDLNDDHFLALNGYEVDIDEKEPSWDSLQEMAYHRRSTHLCLIALEPETEQHLFEFYGARLSHLRVRVPGTDDGQWFYKIENMNEVIRQARAAGFFVTYNHPTWSLEDYSHYSQLEGINAIEICNGSSFLAGYEEYNPRVYDDILRLGKRIFCIGADDNHNNGDPAHWDSGIAWTVIKAPQLEYRAVTKALEAGHFYASQGPEIYGLWVEDGTLHVRCSNAETIRFNFGARFTKTFRAEEGESVNQASIPLDPYYKYVRVTVTDHRGRHANSNAYYIQDIL